MVHFTEDSGLKTHVVGKKPWGKVFRNTLVNADGRYMHGPAMFGRDAQFKNGHSISEDTPTSNLINGAA
jgi:hypothetical protein